MAKIKNYDGQTDMELSYVAVQATRPKKKTVDWVGITETFIAGGMWVIVFMMLGAALEIGNEATVDTGYVWVDKENMDDPDVKGMLYE